jgi:outer membrane receptor protein involved in Fe transport
MSIGVGWLRLCRVSFVATYCDIVLQQEKGNSMQMPTILQRFGWALPGMWIAGCGMSLVMSVLVLTTAPASAEMADRDQPEEEESSGSEFAEGGFADSFGDELFESDEALEDELLLFADMQVVISGTRREVPIALSSVPTSVLTAKDIHYSGLTRLDDLLQFVPGVDSLQADRNRPGVGVRGLHDSSSDRTLFLINGRNASSPFFGGMELLRHPLFIHDIERIEVVRGPGGAAWGANAFNGVVNVITKRPSDMQGLMLSSRITHFGDTYSQLRWADGVDDWHWRVSLGYESHRSSQDAIGKGQFISRDFSRAPSIDTEFEHSFSDDATLRFGLGYKQAIIGDHEFLGFFPMRDGRLDTLRAFARMDFNLDGGAEAYVQWFTNYSRSDQPSLALTRSVETDFEGQVNFEPFDGHAVSVGGNIRWIHLNAERNSPESLTYVGLPDDEFFGGAFLIDRWQVTPQFVLEGQIRGDHYSETGTDWSGRLSALYSLDEQQHHVLRVSGAKAFRAPLSGFSRVIVRSQEVAPGLFAVNLDPLTSLDNEQLWSLEAGYTGRLTSDLTLRVDGYYQWYEDLVGIRVLPDPLGLGRFFGTFDNIGGGNAYGVEAELAYTHEKGRFSVWYAYNGFSTDRANQDVRAFLPAPHKVGATGRLHLPADWTLNANYRWTARTPGNPSEGIDVRSHHRLDLAVAKGFANGRGELMVGVQDVFDDTRLNVFGLGDFTSHETPGRALFIRLQLEF